MSLITKIKESIEARGLNCIYDSLGMINQKLDYSSYPLAFFTLIKEGGLISVNGIYRELANIAVFFVKPSTFDFESLENEQIIDECKTLALGWLDSLKWGGVLRAEVLRTDRVYNYADSILTGYALNLRISELEGENCLNDLIPPERKRTVIFNVEDGGSITKDSGIYIVDSKVSVEAIPNQYYEFDGWYSDGVLLSSDPTYMFTVEEDITIDVKFEKIPLTITTNSNTSVFLINSNNETYELELSEGENNYYGDVEGFDIPDIISLVATANPGIDVDQKLVSIDAHALNNWTSVVKNGLFGCITLTSIVLPRSIQSIEQGGIRQCSRLEELICLPEIPPTLSNSALSGTSGIFYVPADSVDDYKTAWTIYADRIQAITE